MTKIRLSILLVTLMSSFYSKGQFNVISKTTSTNLTKDSTDYVLDSAYLTEGQSFPFFLDDLKPGKSLLLQKMTKNEIIRHRIKSIQIKNVYTADFDKMGNIIFEKWYSWTDGSRFSYEYANDGKPTSISVITEKRWTISKAKYKYDYQGKLLQAGELLFKYYPDGKLKSVEDANEIESYQYDTNQRLAHIRFDLKPGVVGCGNREADWIGKYNAVGQLISEQILGFPENVTKIHEYSKNGLLKQTKYSRLFENLITKYFYENGLLVSTKTYDQEGKLISTENYTYKKY